MVHALGQIIEKLGIMQIVFAMERRKGRRRSVRKSQKKSGSEMKDKGRDGMTG